MTEHGNNPEVVIAQPQVSRIRASGPILLLAILFVVGAFLTWYFTWFGRELSDAEIGKYLVDEKHPRKVQHALLQIQQRIERGDPSAKQWYPQLIGLAGNPETEIRLTVAWVMGFDHSSEEFHAALLKLLSDLEPIVRRNAALALVRFKDSTGRKELTSILEPYSVRAPAEGVLNSTLNPGSGVSRGTLLARLLKSDNAIMEIRSPLPGTVETLSAHSGDRVASGELILTLRSDEESVWEALRGLALIGEQEDLPAVERCLEQTGPASDRLKEQAALTVNAIQSRKNSSVR